MWSRTTDTDPRVKAAAEKKAAKKSTEAGSVSVSPTYDIELRAIVDLARGNHWDEAESRASALYALDPKDSSVQRVYNWVKTEGPKHREKVLEDKIREVASQDTRFNPTLKSILTDKKTQGLPPRSDLRDAIEQIKATPYIPETFGKTTPSKVTPEDFRVNKGKMATLLDKEIDAHLDNVTLQQLIFQVGQAEGINFIADTSLPAYQKKLSISAKGMKLAEFLHYVEKNLGVQFQVGANSIGIVDGKDPSKTFEPTRIFRLRKGFVLPAQFGVSDAVKTTTTAPDKAVTVTETQKFENFVRDGTPQNPTLEAALKSFFTGKYQIDYEHNQILARGSEEQLRLIERLIDTFDRPLQQVLIEARFITVTEGTYLKLGVAWETGRNQFSSRTPVDYTGLGGNDTSLGLEETKYAVLGRSSLSATLTAIDQSGESETLSSPKLTVVNNLPATMQDGTVQYYYEEYQVKQTVLQYAASSTVVPQGKPASITSGVSLNVLASIGNDGKSVMLALRPEVTEDVQMVTFATISDHDAAGNVTSTFDIKLPEVRKQSLSTRLTIKSGQTIAMGGVLERQQTTFVEAVPVLGKLPIIGAAFRRRIEQDSPRYLLVFVTATIVAETGEFVVTPEEK